MALPLPPQPLPRALTEDEIITIAQRHAKSYAQLLELINTSVSRDNATFENTVLPIASLENAQASDSALIKALKYCSPKLSVQKACEDAETLWREFGHDQRTKLYQLITSAVARATDSPHTPVTRLAEKMLSDLQKLGFSDMSGACSEKIRQNKESIEQLSMVFLRNLREEGHSIETSTDQLDGVLEQLQNTHLIEIEGQPSRVRVPYAGNYNTIMRLAHNADIRKRMYEIHSTRYIKNISLFKDIILLRDENARLLGYDNHAELRLRDRLAPSVAAVNVLLTSTIDKLRQLKKPSTINKPIVSKPLETNKEKTAVLAWDKAYNKAKLQTSNTNAAGATTFAEYFPLWHTFQKIMSLAQDIFELEFKPIAPSVLLEDNWPTDVKGWVVWEREPNGIGSFVGYLLADLQNRPHKYKGNQSVNLQPGYTRDDGTRAYPANLLMCCFDASPDHDYLLEHDNIRTLFHEFGHSLHDLLACTAFAKQHGYNVKRELGEAIAFTFEQWAWNTKELKEISCHYSFLGKDDAMGELRDLHKARIPDDILTQRLQRQASTNRYNTTGQLILCMFDMAVHTPSTHQALLDMHEATVWRDVLCRVTSMTAPSMSDTAHVEFGHLVSGYDAGYYSYVYADVVAANLASSIFTTEPREKQAWTRFRREILQKGGSEDEYTLLERFLGYPPTDTAAFFNMLED